jgi:hypothetical protein
MSKSTTGWYCKECHGNFRVTNAWNVIVERYCINGKIKELYHEFPIEDNFLEQMRHNGFQAHIRFY